jgi:nucleoside-diphosphate-sugar epimerase
MNAGQPHAITSGAYDWAGKAVLVTGGAGFVGSYLVEDLLALGARVRVVDDLSTGSLDNLGQVREVEFVEGDLRDPDVARSAVADMDVVLQLAARAYGMLRSMENNPEVFGTTA